MHGIESGMSTRCSEAVSVVSEGNRYVAEDDERLWERQ